MGHTSRKLQVISVTCVFVMSWSIMKLDELYSDGLLLSQNIFYHFLVHTFIVFDVKKGSIE